MLMKKNFMCGAAIRDITPTVENGVLPMPVGYSATMKVMSCVNDPVNLRVIALRDDDSTVLLVSMDVVNLDASIYVPALSEHTGVPMEAIFMTETGAHATVRAGGECRGERTPEGERKSRIYSDIVMKQMLSAADEAIAGLRPARAGVGRAESYVNVNRYVTGTAHENGISFRYAEMGVNPAGPSDHTVSVIRFDDMDGEPIAFIINFAVFNVLMDSNDLGENGTAAISADLGGYVETHVEKHFPGAVAMWTTGAGCDQNPIICARMQYPDPDNDDFVKFEFPGKAAADILRYVGQINYADTLKAIGSIAETREPEDIAYALGDIMIPSRLQTIVQKPESGYDWVRYSDAPERALHLEVLRIGDIAIAFHGGGLFSSIGMHMKKESILKDTIVAVGYVSPLVEFDGAIVDDEQLEIGGHDAKKFRFRPGFAKSAITLLMNQLIMKTEKKPYFYETPDRKAKFF